MNTENYIPGLSFGVTRAWDAYQSAWYAEDAAADLCPGVHCHDDGDRIEFEGLCDHDSAAGRLHRGTQQTLSNARKVHDYLKELETRERDGRATAEREARAAARRELKASREISPDDELTAVAAAVFAAADQAFVSGTVRGRTVAEQKRADAVAPTGGWRS